VRPSTLEAQAVLIRDLDGKGRKFLENIQVPVVIEIAPKSRAKTWLILPTVTR
jgi:hypothetical protein